MTPKPIPRPHEGFKVFNIEIDIIGENILVNFVLKNFNATLSDISSKHPHIM